MNYTAKDIEVLDSIEGIRKRPSMYIGSVDEQGFHHLIFEVIDNSIDEALAGYCNEIRVIINEDNSITVLDNGRGIPVDIHPKFKKPAVEIIFTHLHKGAKFSNKIYRISGGLHGVGLTVVNALSEFLIAEIYRDGKVYRLAFKKGKLVESLRVVGKSKKRGTKITFKPDKDIFKNVNINYDLVKNRLEELSYILGDTIKIYLEDKRLNKKEIIKNKKGIITIIEKLSKNKSLMFNPIHFKVEKDNKKLEVAFSYIENAEEEKIISFVNTIRTNEHGTHVSGFKYGLTRALNKVAKELNILKGDNLTGRDIREGLIAVISLFIPNPSFSGQTKTKLTNPEIKTFVENEISKYLERFFLENKDITKRIVEKALISKEIRETLKKKKEMIRKRFEKILLPGKLADCTEKNIEKRELFIVEGDSAGGSAKQARDRRFQAILPIQGKILNVEKTRFTKILENKEIKSILTAIGTGVGEDFDINKLRYGKIIIMTDADVDGMHIRALLLTLFYRYMKKLIEEGRVYVAKTPLYRVRIGNEDHYVYTDKELNELLKKFSGKNILIQRFKGLGEMNPEQLWKTAMDPRSRILLRITIKDAKEAEELVTKLMGENTSHRKDFIKKFSKHAKNLDI